MKSKYFTTLLIMCTLLYSCGNNKSSSESSEEGTPKDTSLSNQSQTTDSTKMNTNLAFDPTNLPQEPIFEINTTEGTIVVKLYKNTPIHRDNFVKLASERFFDGILFHRVINGFMIQTGDPLTKDPSKGDLYGTGGPGYTIPAEFVKEYVHKKGALAAARRGNQANPKKESSGSQFYIVQTSEGCSHLNGEHTVFGETIEGMDVIDKIAGVPTTRMDRPITEIKIISIMPRQ